MDNDPLEISVRNTDWHTPGEEPDPPDEYRILLTTGGPAVQITGELEDGLPRNARLECQDWFTPWTDVIIDHEKHEYLLEYARHFFFGE